MEKQKHGPDTPPLSPEGGRMGEGKRALVCGSRDWKDRWFVFRHLDEVHLTQPIGLVIEGGAGGVDSFAAQWASFNHVECRTYRALWRHHGNAAGPIRNQHMLTDGKPDLVVAFPGGRGTADMVRRAKAAGVPIIEIPTPENSNDK